MNKKRTYRLYLPLLKFFSFQIMIWRRMIQGFWSFGFTSESKQLAINKDGRGHDIIIWSPPDT